MSWFVNFKKPKIKTSIESKIPANLWKKCTQCNEMIFSQNWEKALFVCPNCNFHDRITAFERLKMIANQYQLLEIKKNKDDILKFKDKQPYCKKLKENRIKTKLQDAAIAAKITLGNNNAIVFIMDFEFIGGSMGTHVGNCFEKAAQTAIETKTPLIAITASGGARMQEGIISLMQMPKTVIMCKKLKENKIPYIVVLTNPSTGGVIASFAMLGDITLAEPNALIGFTGPRVIEETMQIKLAKGFQKAEFQLKHGFIDAIIQRKDLKTELSKIVNLLTNKGKEKK